MTPTPNDTSPLQLITVGGARVLILALASTMESEEFDPLNQAMSRLLQGDAGGHWVLDLTAVQYAGSSLLGMLLNARTQLHASGGTLVVCGLSSKLRSIFQTCSLESLFDIRRSRDDALRFLARA